MKVLGVLIFGALAIASCYTVWPTPWRTFQKGPAGLYRENRWSGQVERLTDIGWEAPEAEAQRLKVQEAAKAASWSQGWETGRQAGYSQGYKEGWAVGKKTGYDAGWQGGFQASMAAFASTPAPAVRLPGW